MILPNLAAAALIISIATGPLAEPPVERLSLQQRDAAARVYARLATDCIVRVVSTDSRLQKDNPEMNLGDLIVDAVPQCLGPVRAMVDAYDRYFGDGAGERFLMGAYLDALPNVAIKSIRKATEGGSPPDRVGAQHDAPGYSP